VRLLAVASSPAGHDQRGSGEHRATAPKPSAAPGEAAAPAPKIFADSAAMACGCTPPEIDQFIQTDVWEDTYAAA
jgi:hypothetical protein